MLKFICPECKTENMLNEGTSTCLCAGCGCIHRIVPELNTNSEAHKYRSELESAFFKGEFDSALAAAEKYYAAIKTVPAYYLKECLSAMVNSTQPDDALIEQFIVLGFEGHKQMMAWKTIDNWLKTQFTHPFYSQWLLALSDFHFTHKAVFNEERYEASARSELNRVLTPNETYGIEPISEVKPEKNLEQSEDTSAKSDIIDAESLNDIVDVEDIAINSISSPSISDENQPHIDDTAISDNLLRSFSGRKINTSPSYVPNSDLSNVINKYNNETRDKKKNSGGWIALFCLALAVYILARAWLS